jgi:hypothetical protein
MRTQAIARTITRPTRLASIVLVGVSALSSCRGGCRRGEVADRAATVEGRLALFPAATQVVAAIDATRLRDSPVAAKLAALGTQSPEDKQLLETFASRTGFDPMKQISSVTVAFPQEARAQGELGLVLRAEKLDEARLIAYVRDELQKTGDDLVATPHGKYVLWSTRRDPSLAGFFVDAQTFVLGAGGWAPRMADLAETARPGDSAATNVDLTHLVEQAAKAHAIWGAAIVPETARRNLAGDPRFAAAAAVLTLSVGVDLGKGLDATVLATLTTAADARDLASKATEAVRDAKRNAQILMLGLGPYLDGVTARAVDKSFELKAGLGEAAVDDLIVRLQGLLSLARGAAVPGFPVPGK